MKIRTYIPVMSPIGAIPHVPLTTLIKMMIRYIPDITDCMFHIYHTHYILNNVVKRARNRRIEG